MRKIQKTLMVLMALGALLLVPMSAQAEQAPPLTIEGPAVAVDGAPKDARTPDMAMGCAWVVRHSPYSITVDNGCAHPLYYRVSTDAGMSGCLRQAPHSRANFRSVPPNVIHGIRGC